MVHGAAEREASGEGEAAGGVDPLNPEEQPPES